jgi:hypothetical protein
LRLKSPKNNKPEKDNQENKKLGLLDNIPGLKTSKGVKRTFNISWWKLLLGFALVIIGLIGFVKYMGDNSNMIFAGLAVFGIGPGIILIWFGLSKFKVNYMFFPGKSLPAFTGKENAIILRAIRVDGKDIPEMIEIKKLEEADIPSNSRLHYVKNWKRHFYELYNDTVTNTLKSVRMPDKKSFPPESYKIPAMMQPVKDYLEYSPPSMLQKWAPGILMLAILIVGLLMMVTLGG